MLREWWDDRQRRRRLAVLRAVEQGDGRLSGYPLSKLSGIRSAAVYIYLTALERDGLVDSYWETPELSDRPSRRFYRITESGRATLQQDLRLDES